MKWPSAPLTTTPVRLRACGSYCVPSGAMEAWVDGVLNAVAYHWPGSRQLNATFRPAASRKASIGGVYRG